YDTSRLTDPDGRELDLLARRAKLMGRTTWFPEVNALLNATSFVLLALGYFLIRAGKVQAHKVCMVSALAVSAAFLACYLTYHARVGSLRFPGEGGARQLYSAILVTHVLLAFAVVPLAGTTAVLAWRGAFERHARTARITFPIWLYVSATGVAVYLFLYRVFI